MSYRVEGREMQPRFGDGRDWFFSKRFGLFLHWGLYALDGWHEQHLYRRRLRRAEFAPRLEQFNPRGFDPDAWLDLASECGMEYLVITAKHIDGFCLFDSAHTDFKVTRTPFRRDIIGLLADACHRRGFAFGVYYSIVDNWHRNYPKANRAHECALEPDDRPDLERYRAYVRAQVTELCSNYGELREFWWDANHVVREDPTRQDRSFNDLIRRLQPTAVINNRGWDDGDFGTPERDYDAAAAGIQPFGVPTEACESVGSQSWGYRTDEDYFTDKYLMQRMDLMLGKGGNYLLNVGPDGDGRIPGEPQRILRRLGAWYSQTKEALVEVEFAQGLTTNREVLLTRRGNTLYVHCVRDPRTCGIALPPLTVLPRRATLLNTGEPVRFDLNRQPALHLQPTPECLRLHDLPFNRLTDSVPVIRLEFDALPAMAAAAAGPGGVGAKER